MKKMNRILKMGLLLVAAALLLAGCGPSPSQTPSPTPAPVSQTPSPEPTATPTPVPTPTPTLTPRTYISLPEDEGLFGPKNLLTDTFYHKSLEEVEAVLGMEGEEGTLSRDRVYPCDVSFGQASADQVELQFTEEGGMSAIVYTFGSFTEPEEAWAFIQTLVDQAREEGATSATDHYWGRGDENAWDKYQSYEEFDESAQAAIERGELMPLYTGEARYFVNDGMYAIYSLEFGWVYPFQVKVTYADIPEKMLQWDPYWNAQE